jgi:hypothetical protein
MYVVFSFVCFALAIVAMLGKRWAYVAFVVLGLLYFPASVGFHFHPRACELALDVPLALFSLSNYAHIRMFGWFSLVSYGQFRSSGKLAIYWAALATMAMGAAVEAAEGLTGRGHCRLRDLVPDAAGALLGAFIAMLWSKVRRRRKPDSA